MPKQICKNQNMSDFNTTCKNFEFHARVQKCHFVRMEKLPKVQTETFLKNNSRNIKNSFYLGFLWNPKKL